MDPTNAAPHAGATDSLSPADDAVPHVATIVLPRWPDANEWPPDDAPPLTVARFYREHFGANVRPTPSAEDTRDYAEWLYREALRDHKDSNAGADPSAQVNERLRDDARSLAQDARKGPIGAIAKSMQGKTATDADLLKWYGDKGNGGRGKHRGICIILGESTKGIPLAQVDTDPRHGGMVAGEWACMDGPRTSTPGGGVHVFTLWSPAIKASSGKHALAPGVEVRVSGFAMMPSGASSPNRGWLSCEAPRAASPAMCRGGTPAKPERRDPNAPRQPWDLPDAAELSGLGRVAWALANEAGEDCRNPGALLIVGMLARPSALPDDAVIEALRLLAEWGTGQDWSAQRLAEEGHRWRELLTRGPRDAEFAAEVLATWIDVRDTNAPRWSQAKARTVARNLWKTADRREEGNAGAEDMGHAGGIADYAPPPRQPPAPVLAPAAHEQPPAPSLSGAALLASLPRPADLPAYNYAPAEAVDKDALEAVRRQMFLRRILPSSAEAYPDDAMDRDMERVPLRIEKLYPFFDFWRVAPEIQSEYGDELVGHGYGRWLASALGGLLPGDFKVIGGAGAKIGKTHLLGQCLEGLALNAAARILGIPGYETAPIVMTVWVTEMPKPGEVKLRMLSRHFGFDMAAVTMASAAEEAAGIMHMANEAQCLPGVVVKHARAIVKHYRNNETDPVGFVLRHLNKELALSEFPAPTGTGRNYVDHASGVNLVSHLADAVALRRADLAQLLGVTEDQITPIIAIDPGQRFIGGDGSKKELDGFLNAVLSKLCRTHNGLGAIVMMTSDTTKAAAKDIDLDTFMSGQGPSLAADIFAGSQAWMHIPDTVIAVCGQDGGVPYRRTQWVRVLQGRTGAPAEVYPFSWETHLGRFRPRKSEPLRTPAHDSGGGRGGGRSFSPPPPGSVGDHGRTRPRPPFSGRARSGHPDD
jgi:hypothetical protein